MQSGGSRYDPESGMLRLRHATLSVLARLAVAPTDPSLQDHDVAPLVAELRALGILTPRGIEPAVAPLAETVGGASTTFRVELDDHGRVHRFRGWLSPVLGVVAAEVPGTDDHELMADVPAMVPSLLADLVGLGAAAEPPVEGTRLVDAQSLAAVVARGTAVTVEEVAAAIGDAEPVWVRALTDAVRGAALRWQLRTGRRQLDVLDAGRSGLWMLQQVDAHRTRVTPTTTPELRAVMARMLGADERR